MRGSYDVVINSRRLQYKFTIRRNITVIRGQSATGKTTLVEMIRDCNENGIDSGITIKCDKECVVLSGRKWERDIAELENSIVFIDEGHNFVLSQEFAEAIKKTSNYYVIVTRERLENIPYSVDEIYGIRNSGKYGKLQASYHEFYRLYENIPMGQPKPIKKLLTEDSRAGYQFFSEVGTDKGVTCASAGGKSNVAAAIMACHEPVLVVADGAAFGPEMERITELMKLRDGIYLYLPESFEWLILQSGLITKENLTDILATPYDYIDSEKYFSWEQFFTTILQDSTRGTLYQYVKNKLNPVYLHEANKMKILAVMKPLMNRWGW
ncbi:translation initiation factor 2 [Selenomonas ruminis]|uniref:Translation initiation factor 2 n=1 Tax=Selenomonas ruminis TaxID=2593411 RepID=A0A5D6W6Z7_9FIRM|nr:translation initiation factor 2 [Selenomonas sp. mPRGC5]TYZ24053.1 translation initiation factor 2 [Selenomonas sp. mPRGC5]